MAPSEANRTRSRTAGKGTDRARRGLSIPPVSQQALSVVAFSRKNRGHPQKVRPGSTTTDPDVPGTPVEEPRRSTHGCGLSGCPNPLRGSRMRADQQLCGRRGARGEPPLDRHDRRPLGTGVELLARRQRPLPRGPGNGRLRPPGVPGDGRGRPRGPRVPHPRRHLPGPAGHPSVPGRGHRAAHPQQHPRGRPGRRPQGPHRLRRQRPDGAGPRARPAHRPRGGQRALRRRRSVRARESPGRCTRAPGLRPAHRPDDPGHHGPHPRQREGLLGSACLRGRPALGQLPGSLRRQQHQRAHDRGLTAVERVSRCALPLAQPRGDRRFLHRSGTGGAGCGLGFAVAPAGDRGRYAR